MPTSTEIRVLGGLALDHDGDSHAMGGPKAQLLLSVLVARRNQRLSIDRLAEAVWLDNPPKSATATIQSQISRLRSVLTPGFAITFESAGYQLETLDGQIDAGRFEVLLAKSRTAATAEAINSLDTALALWHGPAFGQYADTTEVHSEALRLDELRLVATDEWAVAKMELGDPASMVGELEALVSLHPLRERYWRLLMLALYRTGRQTEALRRANDLRTVLGREVGLEPSPALRQLESQILADDPSLLVERDSSRNPRPPTVVTSQLRGATSFIGREPTVASVAEALEDQPVVTITGPGGVGKTRLAMRVAATLVERFSDGVRIVELAPLRDPAGTAQVIAQSLDVQPGQHRTIETTIEDFLAPTRSLLVLDNCEHVIEAVAPLIDRLRSACPDLRILATSRQSLGLAGEYVEVLAPLSLPPSGAALTDIRKSTAVELFVERAAAASPGFALNDDNALAVVEVCERLDGLPLALELAAARLRTMGVHALAAQVKQRTEMLGQTQRGADGRHRSLHDLVRWSYDLLTREEQRVFAQLSVFAGGFDLVAAESVCSDGESQMSAVGDITSLVDKSMVEMVDPATSRYHVLEPLREFGLDQLQELGDLEATEDRHLLWFLDLAERGSVSLDGPEESKWSADLLRDYANFRVAHLTAIRRRDAACALRLTASLREFAFRRVEYEITSWAEDAAALTEAEGDPNLATALAVSAYGRWVQGDLRTAIELAKRALEISENPELSETGLPERVLGNVYFYLDDTDQALTWIDRMVLSARRSGSSGQLAHGLYMSSVARTAAVADGVRGAVLAGEAKAAATAAGSPTAHAQADYALGLALELTEPAEALSLLERASVGAAEAGNRWVEAFALTEVHSLRAKQGEHLSALAGYADVIDTWYRGGDWTNQWLSLRQVLGVLVEVDAIEAAAVLHGALTAVGAVQALPFMAADAERVSTLVDDVRSRLGSNVFADAVRQGTSMRDREIVSFVKQNIASLTDDSAN